MNQALQRCGFNPATVNYLIDQGFASPSDLMLASESDLDSIARTVGMNQLAIISAAKIPLIYLARDEREPPAAVLDPADFESPTEYLIEATVFEGRHYELDNPRFYRELKTFVVNGEGWSYIKKFERSQDGRKAYLALKTQCEGTASKITRKNKAYAGFKRNLQRITSPVQIPGLY
ncbi:hypothetical protein MHU86_10225 [Fragilaria crotonensis]|nr:hypothetical protein MHU86_10225 [Fragilaria crotonensis]